MAVPLVEREGNQSAQVNANTGERGRNMPDIVLTRIDNRLIHGQVATQWCGVVGANLLLVANDAVSTDEFLSLIHI